VINRSQADEPLIARDATYHRAPETLRQRVRTSLANEHRKEKRNFSLRGFFLAAAFAAVAVLSWNVALMTADAGGSRVDGELLDAHLRSLTMPERLSDVASSDRHTVKPWFAGKLAFAPEVIDAQAAGFTLVGGRLDYLEGRPVAAISYRYRLHTVNLFERPSTAGDAAAQSFTRQGFSLVHWRRNGLEYWALSDLALPELALLAK
jgi:anti-sigma factor RsiW